MAKNESKLRPGLFRDAKGRIRSLTKISPENQQRIYENKPLIIRDIEVKKFGRKVSKNGRIKVVEQTRYFDAETKKFVSETEYLQNLNTKKQFHPEISEVENTRFAIRWEVLDEIKDKIKRGERVYYKGKQITPGNLTKLIRQIKNDIKEAPKDSNNKYNIIFRVEERGNGDLIVEPIIQRYYGEDKENTNESDEYDESDET